MLNPPSRFLLAIVLGAIAVLGFAPFYIFPATILSLAGLFWLVSRNPSPKPAACLGLGFGLGLFTAGIYWIYISLHNFGGMPFWMAALATFGLSLFMALFPALAAWLAVQARFRASLTIALPLWWTLTEWIRSWIFTGFPWLSMGYSQVPNSPLSGFAPVLGLYGVSLVTALAASLLVSSLQSRLRIRSFVLIAVLFITGAVFKTMPWTHPEGEPIRVALVQGNIPQDIKWEAESLRSTLDRYFTLVQSSTAKLIILPETALPLLPQQLPDGYLAGLQSHASKNGGDILIGVVELDGEAYYNSMMSMGVSPAQVYRKSHLVPFGEFIPFKQVLGWIYRDWLNIPLTDLTRGATDQRPMNVGGMRVAVDICYEDVFGNEIIRQLPQANILVNASNDAWYGESTAAVQHMQISQMRAMETGRMMLRSTNTGATAIISQTGQVLAHAPHFTTQVLEHQVQGYTGATPYVRFGNWPILLLLTAGLGLLWGRKTK